MSVAERDNLAQLRRLAEEGRRAPLLGGRPLIAYGLAITLAAAFQAALLGGWVPLPSWVLALSWSAPMVAAGWLGARGKRSAPVTLANRVERQVWAAGGTVLALSAAAVLLFGMTWQGRLGPSAWAAFAAMPPLTFGVYAIALNASAAAGDQLARLRPFVALSIAFLIGTVLLGPSIEQLLALAAGALVCSVWPGVLLLRREGAA